MKKIIYFLTAASVAVSCHMEEPLPVYPGQPGADYTEGQTVTAIVGISVPGMDSATTKALTEEPGDGITSLYAAVFDDAHFLTQYIKAECLEGYPTVGTDGSSEFKQYKLVFNIGATKPRLVHLIANGPAAVRFGSEEDVIASMTAHKNPDPSKGEIGPDVYWARVLLPDGITYDPNLDEEGNRKLIESSANVLRKVGLTRNFAKFTVKSDASSFVLENAKFLMTPDESYVAAYIKSKGEFVMDYGHYTIQKLRDEGYTASCPATSRVVADFDISPTPASGGKVIEYVFEREKPTSSPACIIIGGRYNGSSSTRYYKVNLLDSNGEYYPILRNFNYDVTVTNIYTDGFNTPEDAYNSAGSGDISVTFEFEDIPKVSNGVSSLQVQYTEQVAVTGDPFTLQYRFTPDISSPATNNKFIWCSQKPTDFPEEAVYVYLGEPGDFGPAIESVSKVSDSGTEGILRIKPVEPGEVTKMQTIHLVAVKKSGGKDLTIQRAVTVSVREKFRFSVDCIPSVLNNSEGESTNLVLTLPVGLRKSLFPLEFQIEAEQLSLAPALGVDLPVEDGNSLISPYRPGYHFVKTIDWSEYYQGDGVVFNPDDYETTFDIGLRTNKKDFSTSIIVLNKYFSSAKTYLYAYGSSGSERFLGLKFDSGFYVGNSDSNTAHPKSSRTSSISYYDKYATSSVTATLTGAVFEANNSNTFTFTPSEVGVQLIPGVVANSFGDPVSVTLSSSGYTSASVTKYRYAEIPSHFFVDSATFTENPRVEEWIENFGYGTAYAGLTVNNYLTYVPVEVTRNLTVTELQAPLVTGLNVQRSGNIGNCKYTYSGTISNYDSRFTYYHATSTNGTKTVLSLDSQHRFSGPSSISSNTVYLFAYDGVKYSNASVLEYGNDFTQGALIPEVGTFTCTGPTEPVRVQFTTSVQSATPLRIYHGSTVGWTTTVGELYQH